MVTQASVKPVPGQTRIVRFLSALRARRAIGRAGLASAGLARRLGPERAARPARAAGMRPTLRLWERPRPGRGRVSSPAPAVAARPGTPPEASVAAGPLARLGGAGTRIAWAGRLLRVPKIGAPAQARRPESFSTGTASVRPDGGGGQRARPGVGPAEGPRAGLPFPLTRPPMPPVSWLGVAPPEPEPATPLPLPLPLRELMPPGAPPMTPPAPPFLPPGPSRTMEPRRPTLPTPAAAVMRRLPEAVPESAPPPAAAPEAQNTGAAGPASRPRLPGLMAGSAAVALADAYLRPVAADTAAAEGHPAVALLFADPGWPTASRPAPADATAQRPPTGEILPPRVSLALGGTLAGREWGPRRPRPDLDRAAMPGHATARTPGRTALDTEEPRRAPVTLALPSLRDGLGDGLPRARRGTPAPAGFELLPRLADRAPEMPLPPRDRTAVRTEAREHLALQRSALGSAPEGTPSGTVSRTPDAAAQGEAPHTIASEPGDRGGAANDVSLLAGEVWALLKRRLAYEAERMGR